MFRRLTLVLALALLTTLPLLAQDSDDKNLDIRSSVGDLHVGSDVDAKKIGVPLYPGARLKTDDKDNNQANLSLLTEAFGFKLVVASYESNDRPAKVVDFYRDKLKRYGKVLECHSHKHGGNVEAHEGQDSDKDSKEGKELKCNENSGPVTELKVGTEDNQHVVAVEPREGTGSTFSLVYVHTRGKRGDI
ncbi:MAG: hypothetical protein DMG79_12910 [Acidobacteria bacterium]|nr:MAG: hypothetical protein DMG79_12910 [Acidobacteriota bacterium]